MCQDVEIVGDKSIPQISINNFIEIMRVETKKLKKKQVKKKMERDVIEKDVLAIELIPSSEEKQNYLSEILNDEEESKSLRQSLQKICPITFSWFLHG